MRNSRARAAQSSDLIFRFSNFGFWFRISTFPISEAWLKVKKSSDAKILLGGSRGIITIQHTQFSAPMEPIHDFAKAKREISTRLLSFWVTLHIKISGKSRGICRNFSFGSFSELRGSYALRFLQVDRTFGKPLYFVVEILHVFLLY